MQIYKGLSILLILLSGYLALAQKKFVPYTELGFGWQNLNTNIPNSKYVKLINSNTPKVFLGFGCKYNLNLFNSLDLNINVNNSKLATQINYSIPSSNFNYLSNTTISNLNTGISLGMRHKIDIKKYDFTLNAGLKFQKISWQSISSDTKLSSISGGSGNDSASIMEIVNTDEIGNHINSYGYYFSIGALMFKKKKQEWLIEINGTFNKPYKNLAEFYDRHVLVEKISYNTNMLVGVFKIRRWF